MSHAVLPPTLTQTPPGPIRRFLDRLFDLSAGLAAACLVAMLGIIVAQMAARWMSLSFPGSTEYAGYLMASASFLAFAKALNTGAHIRVGLALTALGRHRFWGELWCLIIASAAACYLAYYAVRLVYWSRKLGDVSQGQDATPLWLVQIPLAFGACLLALAFLDNLVSLIRTGRDNITEDTSAQTRTE